jgi:carbonic anhydrase
MRIFAILPFLVFISSAIVGASSGASDNSLKKLMDGNDRYIKAKSQSIGNLKEKRQSLVSSQTPFAVIVGCSDSRVPPEIIFDQNLGDLFVVRVAGNVAGPLELDTIEYAAYELKCPLIMVLGHQDCGIVKAVIDGNATDLELEAIAPYIQQAVDESANLPGDRLKNAVEKNVILNMQRLQDNAVLQKLIQKNQLKIVGGYYELGSGKVDWIQ